MAYYQGSQVEVGPGTLYAAPIGTTEPTSISGAWPANWATLGYTTQGSEFSLKPTIAPVEVEEEYWPVRNVITLYEGTLTFEMAETTQRNWVLAVNAGIGSSLVAGTTGTFADGSVWAEMPPIGSEVRVMLGWDSLPEGATSGANPFQRIIVRQCLQGGTIKRTARKGANKSTYACEFHLERPNSTTNPFRLIWPASLTG